MGEMRHRVLACDYDGTIANEGVCSPATIASLERIAATGMRLILVTGRTREELESVFDHSSLFSALVVENGSVVIDADGAETLLAPRLPRGLVEELQRVGVTPLVIGRVLCSTSVTQTAESCRPRSPSSGSTAPSSSTARRRWSCRPGSASGRDRSCAACDRRGPEQRGRDR